MDNFSKSAMQVMVKSWGAPTPTPTDKSLKEYRNKGLFDNWVLPPLPKKEQPKGDGFMRSLRAAMRQ